MQGIKPVAREEAARRWAEKRPSASPSRPPRPSVNLQPILQVGDEEWLTFRGRSYSIKLLPWREGERILHHVLVIKNLGEHVRDEDLPTYYGALRELESAIWDQLTPYSRWERWMKKLGIARNPLEQATEGELADFANFCLGRRMRSRIRNQSDVPAPRAI